MGGGKRLAGGKSRKKPDMSQFSKWMIADIRPLLWIVTLGGFLLAFYCVYKGYTGALPWIGGMVGLPWAAHGVILHGLSEPVQVGPQRGRHHL